MEIFGLLTVLATFLGYFLGRLYKGGFCKLAALSIPASMLLGVAVGLIMSGLTESFSPRYLLTGLVYYIFPYLLFLLLPTFLTATITSFVSRKISTN